MSRYDLVLPMPPTVNHYYQRGAKKIHLTKEVQNYRERAGWEARAQGVTDPLEGELIMAVRFYFGSGKSDIDNRCKGLLDAMNGIAYTDDKQIVELHIYKHKALNPGMIRAVVTIQQK